MNILLDNNEIYIYYKAKIINRLSRGSYHLLFYFYNTNKNIESIFIFPIK